MDLIKSKNIPAKYTTWIIVVILLIINFLLRLFIYFNTNIFAFADYSTYLSEVEKIARDENRYLLIGNFLYAISYLGYFAQKLSGSLDTFFIFNCMLGTLTSLVVFSLMVQISGSFFAGVLTIIIHTLYTEFMVFSSVFYTPVIMMFLLALYILFTKIYLTTSDNTNVFFSGATLILIYLLTFFFKPELKYFPWFLLFPGLVYIRKNKLLSRKIFILAFLLFGFSSLLQYSGIITHPKDNVISNSFIFFGHTDYGGNGGEGSFVYPENKARYETAFKKYCKINNVSEPTLKDHNTFHLQEIFYFISHHPLKWIRLQFTKFFRTFGIVPESTSFKILYTGLLKENLWLSSIAVVTPVILIILMFIFSYNFTAVRQLFCPQAISSRGHKVMDEKISHTSDDETQTTNPHNNISGFLLVYTTLFAYYIIASVFYGQFQERYRMPLMVVFIIPALVIFLISLYKKHLHIRNTFIVKGLIFMLFLIIWSFQAKRALSEKNRFNNAIESIMGVTISYKDSKYYQFPTI